MTPPSDNSIETLLNDLIEEIKKGFVKVLTNEQGFYNMMLTGVHCAGCDVYQDDGTGGCISNLCDLPEFRKEISEKKREYMIMMDNIDKIKEK